LSQPNYSEFVQFSKQELRTAQKDLLHSRTIPSQRRVQAQNQARTLFKVHAVEGNGANFVSPDAKVSAMVRAVCFVNDTTEAINDFTNDSANPSLMVVKATKDAQRWNDLLAITGGALEIPNASSTWPHTNLLPQEHKFWTH
jgi:hypothetical protein